ncbi:MAG: hypothetical protein ACW975_06550 [Candidatus Thorarchaeota archaeon]|jgi:hypothetical protein
MDVGREFTRICGEVGNLSEAVTGISIVDAYYGPPELAPARQAKDRAPEAILHELSEIADLIEDEINQPLRLKYLVTELHSFQSVIKWMTGEDMSYAEIVENVFGIKPTRFSENEVEEAMKNVEAAFSGYPGSDTRDRVERFNLDGQMQGEEAKNYIEGELQQKAKDVGNLFQIKVYDLMNATVTDNGIEYKGVTNKPWGGYNYYQGNYRSINEFNVDRPFSRHGLAAVIYHEYEHHVSNLWREKAYRENDWTDLSIVPLTGRCVISEGTADTAMDFLDVGEGTDDSLRIRALSNLSRMCGMNAALMLNHEHASDDDVVAYLVERTFAKEERIRPSLEFMQPKTKEGKPNLWAPYIFNYLTGRKDFVYPAFLKAREKDMLPEFFRTVYLNPYSGSSRTWDEAFDWL